MTEKAQLLLVPLPAPKLQYHNPGVRGHHHDPSGDTATGPNPSVHQKVELQLSIPVVDYTKSSLEGFRHASGYGVHFPLTTSLWGSGCVKAKFLQKQALCDPKFCHA
mmetsp:Transcript_65826/g.129727  ORF Transcript_65826/g.129727 Transcript_65826/m.129727 type:complete len:107 (-) Transcript_65826:207-527(-)|eukprot:CAMPEP_0172704778 /NCGR_PEP_ID=MMETSP1074-20121228/41930_1 /TAXON_ID=2916 /ORGANISM="Ceratium fusus, Strain PA161109" /LENGTH=106 /DNA_ID=CAMNT_0013527005 /DNA_START=45 /DNA_END=365 /DNA_ORIENTATION=+